MALFPAVRIRGEAFQGWSRVMAIAEGCFSTYARCSETSAAEIPGRHVIQVAATVPLYSVLPTPCLTPLVYEAKAVIHAGAGGDGQACLGGADIFQSEAPIKSGSLMSRIHEDATLLASNDTSASYFDEVWTSPSVLAGDLFCMRLGVPSGRFVEASES